MAAPNKPAPQRAVVDQRYLLDVDDAIALIGLLAKSTPVEYSWGDRCFKFSERDNEGVRIKVLSPSEEAQMAMASEK